ncbi:hypothetical protein B566_EDAN007354 [Ephemera danica]|nr:hypothetical protein B566_EDAN007354 [Ephemera danica]
MQCQVMHRTQGSKAYVTAGFLVQVQDTTNWTVTGQPRLVYGGISDKFNRATNTENYLKGKNLLDPATVSGVQTSLAAEIVPDYVPPGAVPEYLKPLAQALFYKFLLGLDPSKVSAQHRTGAEILVRPISSGEQDFQTDESVWPLNQPVPKIDAVTQCAGEAKYVDDIPLKPGELQAAFAMPGVHGFFRDTDILGPNTFTPSDYNFPENEEIFCSGDVKYAGQTVGIVVAETRGLAMAAAEAVVVNYANVTKPILSIDDVMKTSKGRIKPGTNYFIFLSRVTEPEVKTTNVLNGRFDLGKQFHLALETQVCVVEPVEDGYDVYASTQWMDITQTTVARTLKVPVNSVHVFVRRVGGGFGGKQSRPALLASACAVAAQRLRCPIRLAMSLPANMEVMGKRFAQRHEYTVGFDNNGVIEQVTSHTTQDSGYCLNDSPLGILFYFFNSCYDTTQYVLDGHEVRTDTASNIPCRGPGSIVSEGASYATMMACQELLRRLEPVRISMGNPTWQELVHQAYIENVDLQATYMFSKKDNVKDYGIWGTTIAEVEVDILTGEKQIEGAFVMGIGYWLSEEIKYDVDTGRLLNNRTWNYKAPGPQDIPADFRIHFRKDSPNLTGVLGSKKFPASNENIYLASMTDPSQFVL